MFCGLANVGRRRGKQVQDLCGNRRCKRWSRRPENLYGVRDATGKLGRLVIDTGLMSSGASQKTCLWMVSRRQRIIVYGDAEGFGKGIVQRIRVVALLKLGPFFIFDASHRCNAGSLLLSSKHVRRLKWGYRRVCGGAPTLALYAGQLVPNFLWQADTAHRC